jgi:hypothetical protein
MQSFELSLSIIARSSATDIILFCLANIKVQAEKRSIMKIVGGVGSCWLLIKTAKLICPVLEDSDDLVKASWRLPLSVTVQITPQFQ